MYRRTDPRFRRTLNEISQTFESANESAQANVYSFSHNYVSPCLASVNACFASCTTSCFPASDQRKRSRARSRGRAELNFDFYDDWDNDDEDPGVLGWGNDEFSGLLNNAQPGRQRAMSYGARRGNRRKSLAPQADDPTVIPASSYFGFFGKLTGKIAGPKSLRYMPSAADLQEHPGSSRIGGEHAPLLQEDGQERGVRRHKRTRSNTQGSGNTIDSLSSRGDIFPSEDEIDDAVPLDDEFAMVLERRTTNSATDEAASGRKSKRPSTGSRPSTRTISSRSSRGSQRFSQGLDGDSPVRSIILAEEEPKVISSLSELQREEERTRQEEEKGITQKRAAARRLALERGMSQDLAVSPGLRSNSLSSPLMTSLQSPSAEKRLPPPPPSPSPPPPTAEENYHDHDGSVTPASEPTTPFPAFDPPPMSEASATIEADPQQFPSNHGGFNPARLPQLGNHSNDNQRTED